MAEYEKLAISLRPEDTKFLDEVAQEKSVARSAVIRWAIAHYRAFLLSTDSTCRIIPTSESPEQPQPAESAA